ncbi:MAG TPA: SDR family oxidoreductase [Acidimicrobiia bacterium]|nr:SDR family oxidoreductase [Acidimicrobiia bacterium]
MELAGKVAVVTGGSRGIGKAIAGRLAEEGADVVISARTGETLELAAKEMSEATGRRAVAVSADLSTLEGCVTLHNEALAAFEHIDILVNSAGATKSGPFLELSDEIWHEGFDLKFFGAVRLSRLFWPQLVDSHGSVVYIVGGMARTPNPNFAIGGSVNAALANFGKALAGLGLIDDVNVNMIHPGQIQTERLNEIMAAQATQSGRTPEELLSEAIQRQGIRRLGTTKDVAELAVFLCLPRSRHIQGTAISVDGGATKSLF